MSDYEEPNFYIKTASWKPEIYATCICQLCPQKAVEQFNFLYSLMKVVAKMITRKMYFCGLL